MNLVHDQLCASRWWSRRVESRLLPFGLEGVELGDDVLEIGPGFGATSRVLARRTPRLTIVELEERYCRRLRAGLGADVEVVEGDATALPFEDARFSAVVCFTMLHHIPSPEAQDLALSEAARVLRPGGVFAGTDSVGTGFVFRAIHVGDTLNVIDPAGLPARLRAAGLDRPEVERRGGSFRFRALRAA